MKRTLIAVTLLLATNASAVRLEVRPAASLSRVDAPRKAMKLSEARGVFRLDDGSLWVSHPAPARREPSAIAVTRFDPDGSATAFLVSDWLPKGTIPRGLCGQVRSVTQLTDGRIAISAGWNDGAQSHNGVFILRRRDDGRYDTERLVELPGVSQIVGTHRNGILAVTDNPSRRDHGAILTVIDAEGNAFGVQLSPETETLTAVEAAQNASRAKLQRVGQNLFAFYNPAIEEVLTLRIDVGHREATIAARNNLFIGDDAALAALPVVAINVTDDDDLVVVRVGDLRGVIGTHITVYGADNSVKETKTLDRPWNHVIREKGKLHGVVNRGEILLDTVNLTAEQSRRGTMP